MRNVLGTVFVPGCVLKRNGSRRQVYCTVLGLNLQDKCMNYRYKTFIQFKSCIFNILIMRVDKGFPYIDSTLLTELFHP